MRLLPRRNRRADLRIDLWRGGFFLGGVCPDDSGGVRVLLEPITYSARELDRGQRCFFWG